VRDAVLLGFGINLLDVSDRFAFCVDGLGPFFQRYGTFSVFI